MEPVERYDISTREDSEVEEVEEFFEGEADWLAMARDAFDVSDSFFGSSLAKQLEKNLSLFNNKHPSGSKYHTPGYKFRSKIFRPKTRSTVRRHEAAAVGAFFSTEDLVETKAENQKDD